MDLLFPVSVVLFGLAVHALLRKHDAAWNARMAEMERRNAEIIERVRAKQTGD